MANKAIDILYLAKQNRIDILLEGEQLQVKVPKNTDKNLLDEIRDNKELLIDFLKNDIKNSRTYTKILKADRESVGFVPLSHSQERLWFIDQMEGSVPYHMTVSLRLKGDLNVEALSRSLQYIVNRHEVLRTIFLEKDALTFQQIQEKDLWKLDIVDAAVYKNDKPGLQSLLESVIKKPFDLSKDHMLRATLVMLTEKEHLLVVTIHHIATDGWSMGIIVREVASLYKVFTEGLAPELPALDIQYSDYAIWQRNYLQGELLERKIAYWKEKLKNVSVLELPTDYQRPQIQSARGALRNFEIDATLSGELHTLSRKEGTTLFMTLVAGFTILLYKYSGQTDICVGTPIANRPQKELENLVGFFVNTLVLRSQFKENESFKDFLQEVKATCMEAYEHQEIPIEKVVEAVVKDRDISRTPLFQTLFALQNNAENKGFGLGNLDLSQEPLSTNTSKFDLTFSLTETNAGLQGSVRVQHRLIQSRNHRQNGASF